jgi:anti-sigma factor ChrR (cupin superfamily)
MDTVDGANLPRSGSSYLAAATDWQPSELPGFWIRNLLVDPAASATTMLMKIDPGAFAGLHSHAELEQIFVLEGSFHDEERVLHAGDYCCRAPGAPHTAGSERGAVVLLVYSRQP